MGVLFLLERDDTNSVHIDIVGRCPGVARVALVTGETHRRRMKQLEMVSSH